jgi:hypothetical protein
MPGNAGAIGTKLPRPSSTLPERTSNRSGKGWFGAFQSIELGRRPYIRSIK